MNIAILDTGLFPDRATMEQAVNYFEPHHSFYRWDLRAPDLADDDWNRIIDELLSAERVIAL